MASGRALGSTPEGIRPVSKRKAIVHFKSGMTYPRGGRSLIEDSETTTKLRAQIRQLEKELAAATESLKLWTGGALFLMLLVAALLLQAIGLFDGGSCSPPECDPY